nr:sigma-70 family RNA polymerase sigma factor [Fusicatenibacter saccharivorans]
MDKNNFSEIYKKYVMTAYSAAMQVVHNEADADDIAQETMVKLYLNIDALDEDLRAEEMELPTLAEEEKQERNHFFREVMDALKDHDESGYYITREIKVHERSEKEVASEMGITIGNLRVKMTRTKKWLCQHFADKARERGFL